ncbi:hypothetical protein TNCV_1587461 [Trichonephila clavipes]|uniref:Uncharacterized protein n=1 Tax=Trichonephila clavipes TaxID=2585209 RepID=A0A8X6UZG4_TRICX|nr:hypothetical protein TNCV_1587461 [Trichonephila clavipes]
MSSNVERKVICQSSITCVQWMTDYENGKNKQQCTLVGIANVYKTTGDGSRNMESRTNDKDELELAPWSPNPRTYQCEDLNPRQNSNPRVNSIVN